MDFSAWLSAKGIKAETLDEATKLALQAQWRAEQNPPTPPPLPPAPTPQVPAPAKNAATFDATCAAIEAEDTRVNYIRERGTEYLRRNIGNTDKLKQIRELCEAAVADQTTDRNKFDLKLMQIDHTRGPLVFSPTKVEANEKLVEAAVCRRAGLPNIEKHYDTQTLEQSEKLFRNGLSLVGVMSHCAQRHGWRGMPEVESRDFLQHAFGRTQDGHALDARMGTTGPSTYSLPTVLGNVANKFLKMGWLSVDPAWMRLAYRRSVNDFKTITTARLNGALMYRTLAPGGEIKHGSLSESTYTNRASTYAIILGITREDRINDDLGAFSENSRHMGRGAGTKVNDLFWTVFLNNSAFFTSGNANVSTGGGSALGTADGAAINAAEVVFMKQTDPNGYPIAIAPRIMAVPPTLANTARRWMGSFGMVQSGTAGLGDSNIFQGRYEVVTSPYMENTTYTGNSNAAWYLLADPNDEAVVEGVALNNRWEPTVEFGDADFNQLGEAWRGYIDIGFAFKEPRAGVRSAGS